MAKKGDIVKIDNFIKSPVKVKKNIKDAFQDLVEAVTTCKIDVKLTINDEYDLHVCTLNDNVENLLQKIKKIVK